MIIDPAKYAELSSTERERADRMLAELDGRLLDNPLETFRPHSGSQEQFFSASTGVVAAFAGNRFGKTCSLVVRSLIECLPTDLIPPHLLRYRIKPRGVPAKGRIICPGKTTHVQGVLIPELRKWCPRHALKGANFDKAYRTQEAILEFLNGSWIQLMTYEQDVDKFGGAALDFIGYDEPPPQDIREECVFRLPYIEWFAMTPLKGAGYVHREVYKKAEEDPDITIIKGSIHDNTTLSQKEKEKALKVVDGDPLRRRAREFGDFVFFGGLIYPDLNRVIVEASEIPALSDLDIVVGMDPGIRNAGFVWMGFDSDNHCHIFHDLLIQDGTPKDYKDAIDQINKRFGIDQINGGHGPTYVMDPSMRNRSLATGESVQGVLNRMGLFPIPGINDVEAGVQDIRKRMQDKSLSISKSCRGLLADLEDYHAEDRPDGEFKPVKGFDHRADAMRYACMYRAWGGFVDEAEKAAGSVWVPGEPVDLDSMLAGYNPGPDLPLGAMM